MGEAMGAAGLVPAGRVTEHIARPMRQPREPREHRTRPQAPAAPPPAPAAEPGHARRRRRERDARRLAAGTSPGSRFSARDLAEQRPSDDDALDLRGPLVDLRDLRVAVVALDRELFRVAVAPEDLNRLAGHATGHPGREELGLGTLDGVRPPGVL